MSLASQLLKYHAIALTTGLPWSAITISADAITHKPCYIPLPDDTAPTIQLDFNVSHQAGIVTLIASYSHQSRPIRKVGIDIVCVHERDETQRIDEEGFDSWASTYADVFSAKEMESIKHVLPMATLMTLSKGVPLSAAENEEISKCGQRNTTLRLRSGQVVVDSNDIIEAKLRRFYTFWALKEAYVKMTGEALLAPWLRELEFRAVRTPLPPAPHTGASITRKSGEDNDEMGWGQEVIRDVQVWYQDRKLEDVSLELQAFGQDFIIASAVSTMKELQSDDDDDDHAEEPAHVLSKGLPPFEMLHVERDILPAAIATREHHLITGNSNV